MQTQGLDRKMAPAAQGRRHNTSMKQPCVYMLASRRNGTLYIGVTSHLAGRIWQHKSGSVPGFTQKYQVKTLV